MIIFRSVSGWDDIALKEIKAITFSCLGSQWPDFIKFKPVAILTIFKLFPENTEDYLPKLLDESITPFWACRYATLISLEKLIKDRNDPRLKNMLLTSNQDSHRFVSAKSNQVYSDASI